MKLSKTSVIVAVAYSAAVVNASTEDVPLPVQTYFLPLPEQQIMDDTFELINPIADGDIISTTSVAIGVSGTVIWYDHHEDGFETDPTSPQQSTTMIWGDGDQSNGCAPGVDPCTDAADVLNAGDVLLLENAVDPHRTISASSIFFDGGDRLQASKAIAITRGEYPTTPGSLLAGAVEVLDTTKWGVSFKCPIGQNVGILAFEYTAMYVMAGEDDTEITIDTKNGNTGTHTLARGESKNFRVNVGATVTASKPVQVDVLAGDLSSTYEMRWFSLLPVELWSNEYLSPVGNSKAMTRGLVYNPSSSAMVVDYVVGPEETTYTMTVPAGEVKQTDQILPDDKGTLFRASSDFIVFEVVDTVNKGELFDWGFPVQPVNSLSPQVLIGWGYGCEGNDCDGTRTESKHAGTGESDLVARSVIWVTPVRAATFHVDFDNNGIIDATYSAAKYESIRISDPNDKDMTGAMIWASDSDNLSTGNPVNFAAAWGQNPDNSFSNDYKALDLGTVVPPYYCLSVQKFACLTVDDNGNGAIDAGETCEVITRTTNNCEDTVSDVESVETCEEASKYAETEICVVDPEPTTTTATTTTQATTTTTTTTTAATTTSVTFTTGDKEGGGGGDPHFQRWGREHSSFHGECDLVMVHSEDFHKGAGLDLHVRTTIQDYFSYIEMAALRVGHSVLEFHNDHFYMDGTKYTPSDLPMSFGDEFKYTISNAEIEEGKNAKFYQYFKVDLHEDSSILFKFYKQYLTINVSGHSNDFESSVGLLGDYHTGDMLDRDGNVLTDANTWGFEWQVSPEDGKLFLDDRAPQLPFEMCRLPTAARPARRHLRADKALLQNAVAACSHIAGSDKELCIDDVMQTGDVGLANLW